MGTLTKIDFHGDTLFAEAREDGPPLVAIKPIIERFGMDWSAQLQRLKRDEIFESSMVIITMETPAGPRDTVALPLDLVPGFLFGISTGSIPDPDVRRLVLAYKRECHAVLYRHFFGREDSKPDPTDGWDWETVERKVRMVRETRLALGKAAAEQLWRDLGLPTPQAPPVERTGALQGLDFVRNFLAERTAEAPGGRVQASALFKAWIEWAAKTGCPQMTQTAFGRCLGTLGLRKVMSQNVHYLGIRILHLAELQG